MRKENIKKRTVDRDIEISKKLANARNKLPLEERLMQRNVESFKKEKIDVE
jgi:hypothetical protein